MEIYRLSDELCEFLEIPLNSGMTKFDAISCIMRYIRANGLQKVNETLIRVDERLAKIIRLEEGEALHAYNIQKALKHNYSSMPAK